MELHLSEKLRSLRQSRGNTQEELANFLGISSQSVSKWERNEGYPDITLLPRIAGYYRVTVDTLLGVDERTKATRVKEITDQYNTLRRHIPLDKNYRLDEGIALIREALNEIPGDFFLEQLLAADLSWKGKSTNSLAEKAALFEEAASLCHDILVRSTEDRWRNCAREILLVIYAEQGKTEEACMLAYQQPGPFTTCEYMLTYVLKGKALTNQYKINAALYYAIFRESILKMQECQIPLTDMISSRELSVHGIPQNEFTESIAQINSTDRSTRG